MDIKTCIALNNGILMEGAIAERVKREFGIIPDDTVALASLVLTERGRAALKTIWGEYIKIAEKYGLPLLTATPTRRANRERLEKAGFGKELLTENVRFLQSLCHDSGAEIYIGGLMGCKGDAYTGEGALSDPEAYDFHRWQADALAAAGVNYLYAGIMPALPEAVAMARAMADTGLPYIISFTVLKTGTLIDKTPISAAIETIDAAAVPKPLGYMANCVHPNILHAALSSPMNETAAVRERFLGLQGNTAELDYEKLDGAENLLGDTPEKFAHDMLRVRDDFRLRLLGGCCGTDARHMELIAKGIQDR